MDKVLKLIDVLKEIESIESIENLEIEKRYFQVVNTLYNFDYEVKEIKEKEENEIKFLLKSKITKIFFTLKKRDKYFCDVEFVGKFYGNIQDCLVELGNYINGI